jgi:hypothetical protein
MPGCSRHPRSPWQRPRPAPGNDCSSMARTKCGVIGCPTADCRRTIRPGGRHRTPARRGPSRRRDRAAIRVHPCPPVRPDDDGFARHARLGAGSPEQGHRLPGSGRTPQGGHEGGLEAFEEGRVGLAGQSPRHADRPAMRMRGRQRHLVRGQAAGHAHPVGQCRRRCRSHRRPRSRCRRSPAPGRSCGYMGAGRRRHPGGEAAHRQSGGRGDVDDRGAGPDHATAPVSNTISPASTVRRRASPSSPGVQSNRIMSARAPGSRPPGRPMADAARVAGHGETLAQRQSSHPRGARHAGAQRIAGAGEKARPGHGRPCRTA